MFFRVEDRAPKSAKSLISSGALNSNLSQLNHKSSYSTFQQNEGGSDFGFKWKQPSFRREVEARGEDSKEILYGIFGHTAEDWGRATEECKRNKKQFAHRNNMSANLQTISEDTADHAKSGRTKIV